MLVITFTTKNGLGAGYLQECFLPFLLDYIHKPTLGTQLFSLCHMTWGGWTRETQGFFSCGASIVECLPAEVP